MYFGCACRQGNFAARDGDFLAVDASGGLGVAVHAGILSSVVPADGRPFDEFPREVVDVHVVADFLRDFPAFAPRVFFAAREVVVRAFGVEGEVVEVFVRAVAAVGLDGFGDHFGQFAERFAAPGVGVEVNARFDAEPLAFGRGVRVFIGAVAVLGGEGDDAFFGIRQGDRDGVVNASGEDFRDTNLAEGVEHADDGGASVFVLHPVVFHAEVIQPRLPLEVSGSADFPAAVRLFYGVEVFAHQPGRFVVHGEGSVAAAGRGGVFRQRDFAGGVGFDVRRGVHPRVIGGDGGVVLFRVG